MNPLVKKEIRLLLPAWIGALLLASTPVWLACLPVQLLRTLGEEALATMSGFCFLLGILLLGIAPFGQEFSFKTSGLLLAQPLSRNRIWLTKISTMTVALASILLTAILAWMIFYFRRPDQVPNLVSEYEIAVIGAATFFSGGLWTTLLFREVTAAFWFTFLVPGAIVTFTGNLCDHFQWSDRTSNIVLTVVLGLYSLGGFFWAHRLFFRAQDVGWTGGNIIFPWRKRFSEHTSAIVPGGLRGRFGAVVWKEIQLHEATLFLTALLLTINLSAIVLWTATANPNLKMLCELTPSLWLLMPLLVGAAVVAEERKLGTLEAQLCLPVSRSAQFSIKFFVALILSLLLGAAVPLLIGNVKEFKSFGDGALWVFPAAAAGIFFVAFYASTLARSTLQALGIAIGIPVVFWAGLASFALLVFEHDDRFVERENTGWVMLAIGMGLPMFLLVLARLMFWNFKWLNHEWKLWRHNAAVIAGFFVAVFILTNAIYYRTWEFLMPADYPHGPARLTGAKSAKLSFGGGVISAILPDGRLLIETLAFKEGRFSGLEWGTSAPDRNVTRFVAGSNWTDVSSGWWGTLAIQSDGSLWCAPQQWEVTPAEMGLARINTSRLFDFTRIGSETNWLHVAGQGGWGGFLLLKRDGSLWIWGNRKYDQANQMLNLKAPPARIGDETNWVELSMLPEPRAKKSDGSIWEWQSSWNGTNQISHFVQNTNLGIQWLNFNNWDAGIGTNGEIWIASGSWYEDRFVPKKKIQLGENTKWKAVAGDGNDSLIALRSDGTLWKWKFLSQIDSAPEKIRGTQLGNHSDWLKLPSLGWGIALAADGSLWDWSSSFANGLFAPSRKPVYLGNIFSDKH